MLLSKVVAAIDLSALAGDCTENPVLLVESFESSCPRSATHFEKRCQHVAFAPDLEPHLAKLEAGQTEVLP